MMDNKERARKLAEAAVVCGVECAEHGPGEWQRWADLAHNLLDGAKTIRERDDNCVSEARDD